VLATICRLATERGGLARAARKTTSNEDHIS
jgi:hypothetical protein